jgi:hypothetical protein
MKKFSIGGIYTNYNIFKVFIRLTDKYQTDHNISVLRNDTIFDSVFGSFPNIIWNGGRNLSGLPTLSINNIRNFIDFYHQNNISVRLTFSNKLIEKKHLGDFYSNQIFELLDPDIDSVILTSDVLKEYIKTRMPRIKTVCSITCIKPDLNDLEAKVDKYDLIVIPSEFNRSITQLKNINKSKIEVLVNERCTPYCPYKEEHQKLISIGNLTYEPSIDENFCNLKHGSIHDAIELSNDEIDDIYSKFQISNFKISSRLINDPEFQICKFMIKDEYQFEFLANLLSNKTKQL